jgi:hypothetical protein
MDSGSADGGILKLRELIEEHPAELTYDLRERFGLTLTDIGSSVTYLDAVYLVSILMRDPSSWTTAAFSGWNYPVSREWIVASHTFDLHASLNSGKGKKPKPYPNPFPNKDVTRTGKTDKSPEEVKRLLAKMNPKEIT